MKKFALFIYFSFSLIIACAQEPQRDKDKDENTKYREYLKNSTFCYCLNKFFPHDSLLLNDGSMDEFFQMDAHSIESVKAVFAYADKYIEEERHKKVMKKNLYVKKCIDLVNSFELDSVVRMMDVHIYK